MAVKTSWSSGDVLTAADLTDTFAAKAALASPALTGTPTAPTAANGTNTTQIATTAFVQSAGGLVLLGSNTVSSAAATNITSVFSATYQNYMIILSDCAGSSASNANFNLSLLTGSTEATTNYAYMGYSADTSAVIGSGGAANQASWLLGPLVSGNKAYSVIWLMNPFTADRTFYDSSLFGGYNTGTSRLTSYRFGGPNTNGSSYDGFRLAIASGTFSCNWRLYGLKNS